MFQQPYTESIVQDVHQYSLEIAKKRLANILEVKEITEELLRERKTKNILLSLLDKEEFKEGQWELNYWLASNLKFEAESSTSFKNKESALQRACKLLLDIYNDKTSFNYFRDLAEKELHTLIQLNNIEYISLKDLNVHEFLFNYCNETMVRIYVAKNILLDLREQKNISVHVSFLGHYLLSHRKIEVDTEINDKQEESVDEQALNVNNLSKYYKLGLNFSEDSGQLLYLNCLIFYEFLKKNVHDFYRLVVLKHNLNHGINHYTLGDKLEKKYRILLNIIQQEAQQQDNLEDGLRAAYLLLGKNKDDYNIKLVHDVIYDYLSLVAEDEEVLQNRFEKIVGRKLSFEDKPNREPIFPNPLSADLTVHRAWYYAIRLTEKPYCPWYESYKSSFEATLNWFFHVEKKNDKDNPFPQEISYGILKFFSENLKKSTVEFQNFFLILSYKWFNHCSKFSVYCAEAWMKRQPEKKFTILYHALTSLIYDLDLEKVKFITKNLITATLFNKIKILLKAIKDPANHDRTLITEFENVVQRAYYQLQKKQNSSIKDDFMLKEYIIFTLFELPQFLLNEKNSMDLGGGIELCQGLRTKLQELMAQFPENATLKSRLIKYDSIFESVATKLEGRILSESSVIADNPKNIPHKKEKKPRKKPLKISLFNNEETELNGNTQAEEDDLQELIKLHEINNQKTGKVCGVKKATTPKKVKEEIKDDLKPIPAEISIIPFEKPKILRIKTAPPILFKDFVQKAVFVSKNEKQKTSCLSPQSTKKKVEQTEVSLNQDLKLNSVEGTENSLKVATEPGCPNDNLPISICPNVADVSEIEKEQAKSPESILFQRYFSEIKPVKGLEIKLPLEIEDLLIQLQNRGYKAAVVGGQVRERILTSIRGEEPNEELLRKKDFDIVTDAPKDVLESLGLKETKKENLYQSSHLNIKIDTYSSKAFSSGFLADCFMRDFTINSLYAVQVGGKNYIVDPTGTGIHDLLNNIIRTNKPELESFVEDPIRILRYLRLLIEYNLLSSLQPDWCKKYLVPIDFKWPPPEELYSHLAKLFLGGKAQQAYQLLLETGLIEIFFPGIDHEEYKAWILSKLDPLKIRTMNNIYNVFIQASIASQLTKVSSDHMDEQLAICQATMKQFSRLYSLPNFLLDPSQVLISVRNLLNQKSNPFFTSPLVFFKLQQKECRVNLQDPEKSFLKENLAPQDKSTDLY